VLIRAARVEDAQVMCQLRAAAIREVCAAHYEAAAVAMWIAEKEPEQYVAAMASHGMLVAEMAEEIVGFGELHVESAEVKAVYVRPDWLRRGVGAALLDALEAAACERAIVQLHLLATLNAIPFYRARGYSLDEMTTFRSTTGAEQPCAKMHKAL
jgi:N-acetylglutamate synthase-like GNAT family acetyltransferase